MGAYVERPLAAVERVESGNALLAPAARRAIAAARAFAAQHEMTLGPVVSVEVRAPTTEERAVTTRDALDLEVRFHGARIGESPAPIRTTIQVPAHAHIESDAVAQRFFVVIRTHGEDADDTRMRIDAGLAALRRAGTPSIPSILTIDRGTIKNAGSLRIVTVTAPTDADSSVTLSALGSLDDVVWVGAGGYQLRRPDDAAAQVSADAVARARVRAQAIADALGLGPVTLASTDVSPRTMPFTITVVPFAETATSTLGRIRLDEDATVNFVAGAP